MKGEDYITQGLILEFQGKADTYGERTDSNGQEVKFAEVKNPDFRYTDTYLNARISSGVDEATFPGGKITREYGGQTEDASVLEPLGITEAEVFEFLIEIILANGPLTRLANDFSTTDDDWKYEYIVTYKDKDETEVLGTEKIFYKGVQVFIHYFDIKVTES